MHRPRRSPAPYGSASAIGWAGNYQGVVTCLGGSFFVQDGIEKRFGFGIYAGGPTTWVDADGYLPAQVTTFASGGASVAITLFADEVVFGGIATSRCIAGSQSTIQPTSPSRRSGPTAG